MTTPLYTFLNAQTSVKEGNKGYTQVTFTLQRSAAFEVEKTIDPDTNKVVSTDTVIEETLNLSLFGADGIGLQGVMGRNDDFRFVGGGPRKQIKVDAGDVDAKTGLPTVSFTIEFRGDTLPEFDEVLSISLDNVYRTTRTDFGDNQPMTRTKPVDGASAETHLLVKDDDFKEGEKADIDEPTGQAHRDMQKEYIALVKELGDKGLSEKARKRMEEEKKKLEEELEGFTPRKDKDLPSDVKEAMEERFDFLKTSVEETAETAWTAPQDAPLAEIAAHDDCADCWEAGWTDMSAALPQDDAFLF